MADIEDADSQLLDKIDGKYGEVGDYDDLVNADEDALLEDDSDGLDIKGYDQEEFYNEDENDTDVLDLEAQDAELDDDLDDKNNSSVTNILAVTSTTSNEIDDSFKETSGDEYNRSTDKFKNERVISDDLPEVQDDVSGFKPNRNNRQFRGRNRGGKFVNQRNSHFQKHRNNNNSNTVHINPHFKGQVKIHNDARLAWDARQKINQKHQVGRVMPFNNQSNKNMIRPWSVQNNQPFQNIQQVYPPAFHQQQQQQHQQQPPPQQPIWNQYPPNNFGQIQIPNQQVPINNQPMFMPSVAPPSQSIFTNQPPNQFTQLQNYNTPMYPTQNMNPIFTNTQFIPPQQQPNQFNVQLDPYLPRFQPNQPPPGFNPNNHFVPPPNQQVQFNSPPRQKQFPSSQRFIKPKINLFNQNKQFHKGSPPKRRNEGITNLIKRKRIVTTGNLHEVKTVETPDTTVMEERQMEDEDEETRLYREQIEQQKLLREKVLAEKEKRRQQAIMEENATKSDVSKHIDLVTTVTQNIARPQKNVNQRNLQVVRMNQPNRNVPTVSFVQNKFLKNNPGKKFNTVQNSNIRVINTANDESNYDKQHLASFLSNRKIIAKDQSLVDTSIVVVSNLAAGTTDVKLRKLCQGIGDVKKLQMSPKERQATIQFNSVASAHEFFKKYQHSMLDLSMIQVALKPTT